MRREKKPMQIFDDLLQWLIVGIVLYIGWLVFKELFL